MKISLLYKHTTTTLPAPPPRGEQSPLASVNVLYAVLDRDKNEPLMCQGGRADPTNHFYEPSDDEADIIYHLQQLVAERYQIRSRPTPDNTGNVVFEAVKLLTFQRDIGEIAWEKPTAAFEGPRAALPGDSSLELQMSHESA